MRGPRLPLHRVLFMVVLALGVSLINPAPVSAQVTTGTLSGTVMTSDNGALPGVTIEAVHTSLTGEGTFMFIAGRNNRYNTIQIDGAVNNDLFGLSSSGTPGGGSGTQPISLDAIQQIQVAVSPYDVRQSGFVGGGINVVT